MPTPTRRPSGKLTTVPHQVVVPAPGHGFVELTIDDYPWQSADAWRPQAKVRIGREPDALVVCFDVADKYVIARTQEFDGPVHEDSCVEFFFDPGETGAYFNIEVNAAGGLKFNRQQSRGVEVTRLTLEDAAQLQLAADPGQLINPELADLCAWSIRYRVPFALLERFGPVDRHRWRGNFYKCAEANSHPHFGSWTPIETPGPDFHRPEFFGDILFTPA